MYIHMFFFDCKCKSLNRLGEHIKQNMKNINKTEKLREKQQIRNTGYPAHEPPRTSIIYLSAEVRGLDILYFGFSCFFSKLFGLSFFCSFLFFFLLKHVFA